MNSRALRVAGPAILLAAALAAIVWALAFGGGAAPLELADPGPVVRWGLPIATMVVNLSAAGMCGTLVAALFALRSGDKPFEIALTAASISAAVFTIASALVGYLGYLDFSAAKPSLDSTFGAQLGQWLVQTEAGRTWLITTIAGAALTVLAFAVRSWTATLFVALLALATLVPMGTQGHSGELSTHNVATTSLILHMLGAAVWLGGLVLMVFIRPAMKRRGMADVLSRYSTIALVAFVVVAVSGTVRAAVGLGGWSGLDSAYGTILLVKVVALLVIGFLGAVYRTRLIARLREDDASRRFWWLVTLELAFMGIASGAAAALARTAPPNVEQLPDVQTPAEILTSSPLPPELTIARWFTEWNIDLLWLFVCAFAIFFYLAGVRRLRRRGDAWPVYRTILWILGILLLFWVTCGPVNAYSDYLFSVHMVGHMLLTMAIPLLLVPGSPVTLIARAVAKRGDGTRGGREWVLWAVHTPFARVVTNPFVAAGLFVGSLWVFYYTDLFRWSLYDHLGHEWMTVHFLITGYLFVQSLVGIDPVPYRLPYPGRLITLIAVMAIHAFFGIAIMMQSGLFVAEWFGSMGRTWGATPLQDQYVGGGAAWSIGEIPTLILAITVAIQWSRNDERAQRRRDRAVDRSGDTELDDYNARLAALAERDARARR
ncbi:MAG: bifunctional copper resistance protein CopD/cytochrome c oxidase assembly protein [Microbacterium sp.]|uniref:cytochrome c oxidase assembly protein n=1 Tax=Microbacterium sp. TaxID=51671 RepID=UPI001AC390AA|nr:cytochrome c oxidase assembly protein [Microbacterium sp.]MBN9154034.1 bifunctional copper resistance protein CopD/cytochrome c oxidase assembly protein [Microbacterium sp.]MBN9174427.1 bifunctional copper resistance protein CopD/cytochrome c oxidase assembly protein [Microbacterium sp.]